MVLKRVTVEGRESLYKTLSSLDSEQQDIYVLFCGDKATETGQSWCSDCVKAEPVIEKALEGLQSGVFIYCFVGDRPTWKNPFNEFRTDPTLRLTEVPTLLKWGTSRRLGSDGCAKDGLVEMLFEAQ